MVHFSQWNERRRGGASLDSLDCLWVRIFFSAQPFIVAATFSAPRCFFPFRYYQFFLIIGFFRIYINRSILRGWVPRGRERDTIMFRRNAALDLKAFLSLLPFRLAGSTLYFFVKSILFFSTKFRKVLRHGATEFLCPFRTAIPSPRTKFNTPEKIHSRIRGARNVLRLNAALNLKAFLALLMFSRLVRSHSTF